MSFQHNLLRATLDRMCGGFTRDEMIITSTAGGMGPSFDSLVLKSSDDGLIGYNHGKNNYARWKLKYGDSGSVSKVQMAEMLSRWDHVDLARIEYKQKMSYLQLTKSLTANYRLLTELEKPNRGYDHGKWLYFNLNLYTDVLVMPSDGRFLYYVK